MGCTLGQACEDVYLRSRSSRSATAALQVPIRRGKGVSCLARRYSGIDQAEASRAYSPSTSSEVPQVGHETSLTTPTAKRHEQEGQVIHEIPAGVSSVGGGAGGLRGPPRSGRPNAGSGAAGPRITFRDPHDGHMNSPGP